LILYFVFFVFVSELMLLGFISLLLTVTQNGIIKICVPESWTRHMLPCSLKDKEEKESAKLTSHFQNFFSSTVRHLLDDKESENEDHQPAAGEKLGHCARKVEKNACYDYHHLPVPITQFFLATFISSSFHMLNQSFMQNFLFRVRFLYYLWRPCITSISLFLS